MGQLFAGVWWRVNFSCAWTLDKITGSNGFIENMTRRRASSGFKNKGKVKSREFCFKKHRIINLLWSWRLSRFCTMGEENLSLFLSTVHLTNSRDGMRNQNSWFLVQITCYCRTNTIAVAIVLFQCHRWEEEMDTWRPETQSEFEPEQTNSISHAFNHYAVIS